MSDTGPVTKWIKGLDLPEQRQVAGQKIVDAYTNELLGLIRGKLHRRFKGILDTQDVAQSVWRCFFEERFELNNRSALFALLTKIAVARTRDKARRLDAAKRDRRREQHFASESAAEFAGARIPKPQPVRRRSKPGSMAISLEADEFFGREVLEQMCQGVQPETAAMWIDLFESLPVDLQEVFGMNIAGFSGKEIAAKLDCDPQTVRRKMERIRRRLERLERD
jgi:RNA polymerase sigma factor (sigma-70 family)